MVVPFLGVRLNAQTRSVGKLCLTMLVMCSWLSLFAAEIRVPNRFRKLGRGNDPFPADKIVEILRGSYGFMWFGTQRGLIRFDGQNIRWYRHDPGDELTLSSDDIQVIFEDEHQQLWVGTMAGLNLLDRKTGLIQRIPLELWEPAVSPNIWSLAKTSRGLWIGTDKGLWCWLDQSERLIQITGIAQVSALAADQDGRLIIGTDGEGVAWLPVDGNRALRLEALSSSRVVTLAVSKDRHVWVGTTEGLFVWDGEPTGELQPQVIAPHQADLDQEFAIRQLCVDHRDRIWIGSDRGLYVWDRGDITAFRHEPSSAASLSQDRVLSVCADDEGLLWVGTGAHGVDQLNLKYDNLGFRPLAGHGVQSMIYDTRGDLWVGTKHGGLARIREGSPAAEPDWFLAEEMIRKVALAEAGHLWVGTERGLLSVDTATTRVRKEWMEMRVWCLLERENRLFLGTDQGVFVYRRGAETEQVLGSSETDIPRLANSIVTSLLFDHRKNLWVGTFGGGLYRWQESTNQLTRYATDQGALRLTADNVMDLVLDRRQRLWIATLSGGINRLDLEADTIQYFSTKQGFPDNAVVSILEDPGGGMWANSAVGLVHFDDDGQRFTVLTSRDGNRLGGAVPGARLLDSRQGWLHFGGTGGLVRFQSGQMEWPSQPRLVFTGLSQRGGSVRHMILPEETVALDPNQAPFSLTYAVLHFLRMEALQYAYLREAVDSDWVETQTNSPVTFTGYLKFGGQDRLRVRADHPAFGRLEANVGLDMDAPHWVNWLPLWISLVVLLLAGGLYLGIARVEAGRRRKLEQKAALAEERRRLAEERATFAERREGLERDERVRQETFALVVQEHLDQVSTEIADSLHDGPLSQLQGVRFRLKGLASPAGMPPSELKHITEVVLPHINQTLRHVCGRLLKPKFAQGMRAEMEQMFRSLQEHHPDWQLTWQVVPQVDAMDSARQIKLFRVLRTLLNNVAKHARATQVNCRLVVEGSEVILAVKDDGVGFAVPADLYQFKDRKHYGLYIVGYFAGSLGGSLHIQSAPGHGTLVTVRFPWTGEANGSED